MVNKLNTPAPARTIEAVRKLETLLQNERDMRSKAIANAAQYSCALDDCRSHIAKLEAALRELIADLKEEGFTGAYTASIEALLNGSK